MHLRGAAHRAGCMHARDTDRHGAFFRSGESNVLSQRSATMEGVCVSAFIDPSVMAVQNPARKRIAQQNVHYSTTSLDCRPDTLPTRHSTACAPAGQPCGCPARSRGTRRRQHDAFLAARSELRLRARQHDRVQRASSRSADLPAAAPRQLGARGDSAARPIAIELGDENAPLHSGPDRQSLFHSERRTHSRDEGLGLLRDTEHSGGEVLGTSTEQFPSPPDPFP